MRNKDQMYEDLRNWEMDAGEDFLDNFGASLNEYNLMFWCLGKGYITEEQLRLFEAEKHTGTEFLYGEEEYSIVNEEEEEDHEKGLEKAYRILADFLTSTNTYQRRVDEFLKKVTRLKFEEALKESYRPNTKVFFELEGKRTYLEKDTPLTADIVLKATWYRDDNY